MRSVFYWSLLIGLFLWPGSMAQERKQMGNLVTEAIPDIPVRIKERMLQYQNIRSARLIDWLPGDKGMLISTRFGETYQLHIVEKAGGARRQITFYPEPVNTAAVPPAGNGDTILFLKDLGGNEFTQIFHFDIAQGKARMVSDGFSVNRGLTFSNKGDRFAFVSTRRNRKDYDIYVSSLQQPEKAIMALEAKGSWAVWDWSPDDTRLLLMQYLSINESYLHILDLATGNKVQLYPERQGIAYKSALWSKDGNGIYYVADEASEFCLLRYYDCKSGQSELLTPQLNWDIERIELSPDGRRLAFEVNEDGVSKLYSLDTNSRKYEPVPGLPNGVIGHCRFHPTGSKIAVAIVDATSAGDIYVVDLQSGSSERWTFSETGGLNPQNFVAPALIHYPTFDEVDAKPRQIPAFYYKPKKGGPWPVVIDIHGGPESQYRPGFYFFTQYLVNELNIAVLAPNVRGSAGYGKSYLKLDNGYLREDSVRDIGKLLDWIATQPELDRTRVVVYGGSYGGYMVLASLTHYNDRLRAGIDVVGISNFVTFLTNTEKYRQDLRRSEYGDERIAEMRDFLHKISPLTHAGKISRPLLIVQGLNDPRVPASEAEQVLKAVKENGGAVWYLLAKDEGHGFRKKSNSDFLTNTMVLFLEQFVLGQ